MLEMVLERNGKKVSLISILKKNKVTVRTVSAINRTKYRLATMISPVLCTKMRYKAAFGKKLDLDNPKTLNEKLLWLKLNRYMKNPLIIQCADKAAVREYVKSCGCEDILIDIYGIYDRAEDIPWDDLPNQFVLKWNFGAGMNIVCTDKSKMDKAAIISQMKKWGKQKYWLDFAEMQYKYCEKKIVCEKLLGSEEMEA